MFYLRQSCIQLGDCGDREIVQLGFVLFLFFFYFYVQVNERFKFCVPETTRLAVVEDCFFFALHCFVEIETRRKKIYKKK